MIALFDQEFAVKQALRAVAKKARYRRPFPFIEKNLDNIYMQS